MKIDTGTIKPLKQLFHNEKINVYPMTLPLDKIHFWKENNRTIFTFERLCRLKKNKLEKISTEEITQFIAELDTHKLQILADSIRRNGVQVPLIIRDDGKLLDGNRRYFACQWLKMKQREPDDKVSEFLENIPVHVIRKDDLKGSLELKILAEANFIPDLKVPWPLDAQARAVDQYYNQFIRENKTDHETALADVVSVFGIQRQRAVDLMDTLKLTKQFIEAGGDEDEQIRRREIVEEKFVYLWEFRNKAMKGRRPLDVETEFPEARELFFHFMAMGCDNPIKNVKQVEPLVQSRRDTTAWNILKESNGTKLRMVVSMMNEKKEIRKAEDKIRVFIAWLKEEESLTSKAKSLLLDVATLASKKAKE
jgi:hypothetical protein